MQFVLLCLVGGSTFLCAATISGQELVRLLGVASVVLLSKMVQLKNGEFYRCSRVIGPHIEVVDLRAYEEIILINNQWFGYIMDMHNEERK